MEGGPTESHAVRPRLELVWSGAASTKFRAPKLRVDIVGRNALVRRARDSAMDRRITLVCAPAGAGKSTLLAQLALACQGAAVVWLSLDEDDSDHLIERLPPEVGVVIGTRVTPDLSLARWRLQGELGELLMGDLQFDIVEAQALATARLADAATPDLVRRKGARPTATCSISWRMKCSPTSPKTCGSSHSGARCCLS